ncbi:GCN5-related N-acetyltransferase [Candidatus Promineifilum breve]|uniref:GCN5-related N-acetyltransferase n=1 Tax=Candidatus Promineifilum breve TaxID=1806508 RepID=A0A160T942_9CHLR|nr:N-acetyltransferase [Candidatus Promineifilum breve]CUS05958.1 GCN5-related N-acetyltransferase [Candidatus Promineifilum breve]
MLIRPEELHDETAIREVNQLAFGQEAEGALVDALREAGAVLCSLVAEDDGRIVGHILFSPATLEDGPSRWEVAALGPVAVHPEHQRRGIGSALILAGLDICRVRGYDVAILLGHPAYYPRFGFRPAAPLGIRWEHDAPEEAFMVMELQAGALAGRQGIIRFRPEFEGV